MIYAGIGSRKTPLNTRKLMRRIASGLASQSYTLRTGGAAGADEAFLQGALNAGGQVELYLPWQGFYRGESDITTSNVEIQYPNVGMRMVAQKHHPAWNNLSQGARKLMSRNTGQVLGRPQNPNSSDLVICWTPDGATGSVSRPTGYNTGGTGQAIRLAASHGVKILNLFHADHIAEALQLAEPNQPAPSRLNYNWSVDPADDEPLPF